ALSGVQFEPQTFAVPPPPQVSPVGHTPPQVTMPPQPSEIVPQLSGDGQVVIGWHVVGQMSSLEGVVDCAQVAPPVQVSFVDVHCSHPPKSTLVLVVSQTDVFPLQAPPLSPQEQRRQPVTVVPEQTAGGVPVLVQLFCLLLQSSCTYHVRPLTVMVSSTMPAAGTQMSAISPPSCQEALLVAHAAGAA